MSDAASYTCPVCAAVVAAARRAAHEEFWCDGPGSDGAATEEAEPEPEPEPEPGQGGGHPSGLAVAGMAAVVQSMVAVELVGTPLHLRFEQQSVFGSVRFMHSPHLMHLVPRQSPSPLSRGRAGGRQASTGGALWRAELMLAEWCVRELSAKAGGQRPGGGPLRVLELGCGAAPAAVTPIRHAPPPVFG